MFFNPHPTGLGFAWADLGILLAWAAARSLVARRRFRWEPTAATHGRRRGARDESRPTRQREANPDMRWYSTRGLTEREAPVARSAGAVRWIAAASEVPQ